MFYSSCPSLPGAICLVSENLFCAPFLFCLVDCACVLTQIGLACILFCPRTPPPVAQRCLFYVFIFLLCCHCISSPSFFQSAVGRSYCRDRRTRACAHSRFHFSECIAFVYSAPSPRRTGNRPHLPSTGPLPLSITLVEPLHPLLPPAQGFAGQCSKRSILLHRTCGGAVEGGFRRRQHYLCTVHTRL